MLALQMEGQILPIALKPNFERFYRKSLRQVVGSRIRARHLLDAYHAWASAEGEQCMTFIVLRQQMTLVGHARVQSNGMHYVDVGLAPDFPDLTDTLPDPFRGFVPPLGQSSQDAQLKMVGKIDAALQALLDLRRSLAPPQVAPHEAAARVLSGQS